MGTVKELAELLKFLHTVKVEGQTNIPVRGLAYHTGHVQPGFIFFCLGGGKADGHDFIPQAVAAGAVAVCGTIGFVGLIIPHMVRILVGPDHRILLPMSFLVGAMFMVATDTFARTFFAPVEIPIGIITSLFGGPFFIYLLRKKKVV